MSGDAGAGPEHYASFAGALVGTTLFRGLDEADIRLLLDALRPDVTRLSGRRPVPNRVDSFMIVVDGTPPSGHAPRFAYGLPELGEPGSAMGLVPAFSLKDNHVSRTPPELKDPYPELPPDTIALVFSPDDLIADRGPEVARIQLAVLRNTAGVLAQKVVDARRKGYIATAGVDIYAPEFSRDGSEGRWR